MTANEPTWSVNKSNQKGEIMQKQFRWWSENFGFAKYNYGWVAQIWKLRIQWVAKPAKWSFVREEELFFLQAGQLWIDNATY